MNIAIKNINYILFAVISAAVFICWGNSYTFFWRDEWEFLSAFRDTEPSFFFESFNGHIKPFFKLLYFTEMKVFGVNTEYYMILNLLVYSFALFVCCKILLLLSGKQKERLLIPIFLFGILMASHPINFSHLLWSFQISQTCFMLFQALSIFYFIKFLESESKIYLGWSIVFLIIQNYFFGNGLFFPLTFIGFILLFKGKKYLKTVFVYLLIFIATILIQAKFGNSEVSFSAILSNFDKVILNYFQFLDLNIGRMFFIGDWVHAKLPFLSLVIFSIIVIFGMRKYAHLRQIISLLLFWFLTNNISIPLVRFDLDSPPYYYSVMSFAPFILILFLILKEVVSIQLQNSRKILLAVCISLLGIFYFFDNRMVNIYSIRNAANEMRLNDAIKENKTYYALDDPYFELGKTYRVKEVKEIYLFWKSQTIYKVNPMLK